MTHLVLALCLKMGCFLPWSERPWCSDITASLNVCVGKDRGNIIPLGTSSAEKL